MIKFTKIIENNNSNSFFKFECYVDLTVKANNQGEASYIADQTLSSIKNQSGYTINKIENVGIDEYNVLSESVYSNQLNLNNDEKLTEYEIILKKWDVDFGDRYPTSSEKLEFYHQLRTIGINGLNIINVIKNKL